MRTLLVDDDPFELQLLSTQLGQLDCEDVTLCESARDALALLESHGHAIDLVFCDLQMPDMDGVEFVRHLARMEFPGGLVLMSGEDARILQTVERLAQAHGIHILGAMPKPLSSEVLQQLLLVQASQASGVPSAQFEPHTWEELREAIQRGELRNHYQPKVDMVSGALVGVETLVRWQHPQLGLVYPDQFIALAEANGLIDALTRTVLHAALHQARKWHDAGLQLHVAVNVSMDNLAALDFPDVAASLAADAGVALSSLVLEVTESRLMQDLRGPLDVLTRLRLKRIGLSIDDFGTGHSSLVQLRDVPFDELKLDRSFVTGSSESPPLAAIVEGTLSMAHQLGIRSVAEGVETRSDWDYMRRARCSVAQGYFIGRPMAADALTDWHVNWELRRRELTADAV